MYVLSQTGRSLSHVKRFLRGHRSARRAACLQCIVNYTDSKPNERTERVPGSKRTAALHIGYIGTDFKGLQASRSLPVDDTIECVLERALLNAGFIAPYNYGDLFKVKWSRNSRTDKGVHSLCTVIAFRILLSDGDAGYEQDPEGLQMAALINSHLPDSIRVFSVQRVQKKFHARHWCQDRTYEYYLPLHVLQDQRSEVQHAAPTEGHAAATELALQNLRVALSTFVGTHAFHNYTTRKGISSSATTQQPPATSLSAVGPEPYVPLASTLIPASSGSSPSMTHPPLLHTALPPNDLSVPAVVDISAADDQQDGKSCKVQFEPSSLHCFDAYAPLNPEAQCMKPSSRSMAATAASRSSSRDGGNLVLSDDSSDDVVMEDAAAEYGDGQHLDSLNYHNDSSRDDFNDPADVRIMSSSAAEDDDSTSGASSLASALSCIVRGYRGKKQRAWVRSCTWQSGSLPKAGHVDRVSPQHYRSIYSWTVSCPTSLVPGGIPCVKLVVHGSSFLLHQIRHMIGAAVAVSKGIMSQQLLEASLNEHCRIQIPRAPPHTLLLSDASFRPFRKETQAASINNKNSTLSASHPNLSTTFSRAEDSCILSDESGSSPEADEPCNHQPDPHNHDNRSLRLMSAPFRFTGDVLELRSGGATNREDFRQQAFDSALNASLSHPDWATFSENIEISKWLEEDVHFVEQELYNWRDRKRTLHPEQNEL